MTPGDGELADFLSQFYENPLGFVLAAWRWNEPGTELAGETGPDENQRAFLKDLGNEVKKRRFNGIDPVMPILMAEASGHGVGKTAQGAWITCWILSTRPGSIGTVTAGTFTQLETRTWAAIRRWMKSCITAHWFHIGATSIRAKRDPENWKVLAQTCKEENAQSFAGQHARTSTSWYLFDEASTVPDEVWKVAFGGLTDGAPMFFAWGQPVRRSGIFYEVCFGSRRGRWLLHSVDSRNSRFTNKELIAEWIRDYGIDSDWCRVRILGLPPSAGELQFIDQDRILAAQRREVEVLNDEPLVAGFDASGGGSAWNVVWFRRGFDARSIPPIRITGEAGRDRDVLVGKLAEVMAERRPDRKVAALFVDSAFGSPIVERLRVLGFKNVHEVNFGSASIDVHQLNTRAYIWNRLKDWLLHGAIPDDTRLEVDLNGPGYHINTAGKLVLESKESMAKRGVASPDNADALALTFARHVAPPVARAVPAYVPASTWS